MKNRFFSLNLDFLGFSASFLCAIHCAILPILLTFGSLGSLEFLDSAIFENSMIALSIFFASTALITSYIKHHRNFLPLSIVMLGFSAIIASRFTEGELIESVLMVTGGLMVAGSHLVNWKLARHSASCEH